MTNEISELREEISELREEISEVREENDELSQRVETLEEENEELREDAEKARDTRKLLVADIYEVDERLTDLEKQFSLDPEPAPDPDDSSTSLERVVSWPDAAAEDELSSNAQHARSVATNLKQFVTRTPRGLKLGSSEVQKAITARTGETPHPSTVYRTMDFLAKFGETLIREDTVRKGERRLYWREDAADRLRDSSHGDVIESRTSNPEEP